VSALGFKMLLRKRGVSLSILAVALPVAIIASMNSITNYIDLQAQILAGIVSPAGTYLILNSSSKALTDSKLDVELACRLSGLSYVKYVYPQKMFTANLTTRIGSCKVYVRGVGDVAGFLKMRGAYVNGTAARSWMEVNIGEILAETLSISLGDEVCLAVGGRQLRARVVGIFRSRVQSDVELLALMEAANMLTGGNDTVSFIEFSLREDVNRSEALSRIMQQLPGNVKLIQTQQLGEFMRQMNMQTASLLNVLSLAVYAVVAVSSYIISVRLIVDSSYEIAMLKALGAGRKLVFTLVATYTATIALIGSIFGVALGIVGVQVASTILRWIQPSIDITPFLKVEQATQIILLTLTSSILGCIIPALKSMRTRYMEQQL